MVLEQKRKDFKKIEKKIGEFFSRPGLTANQYSLISILFVFLSFYFLTKTNLFLSFILFILSIFLDLVDGAVARLTKTTSREGAYIDTICDRYVEGVILLGFLFLPLPPLFLPAEIWILLSLLGSLMTTYSKAAAKEKELVIEELRKGFLGRGERVILISLALFLGIFDISFMIYPIVILAVLSNFTAFQRVFLALGPRKS